MWDLRLKSVYLAASQTYSQREWKGDVTSFCSLFSNRLSPGLNICSRIPHLFYFPPSESFSLLLCWGGVGWGRGGQGVLGESGGVGKHCVWFFSNLNWSELESGLLEGVGAGKEEQGRRRTSHAPRLPKKEKKWKNRADGTLRKYYIVMQQRVMDHKETVINMPVADCISAHSWVLELNTSLLTLQRVLQCWEKNLSNEYGADAFLIMESNKWWKKNDNKRKRFCFRHSK